jgi:hypothetical protein
MHQESTVPEVPLRYIEPYEFLGFVSDCHRGVDPELGVTDPALHGGSISKNSPRIIADGGDPNIA